VLADLKVTPGLVMIAVTAVLASPSQTNICSIQLLDMGTLDPLQPAVLEQLRRSLVMSPPGQSVPIDRERALALIEQLQALREQQQAVAGDLQTVLDRLRA
jgi:hypothetical protein